MEGTGRDRESTRKIFERGAGSGQRNARFHSEGRVQEEKAKSEREKERRQNGWKECRILTEFWREKKNTAKKEREK
jgi:hypothetical protein